MRDGEFLFIPETCQSKSGSGSGSGSELAIIRHLNQDVDVCRTFTLNGPISLNQIQKAGVATVYFIFMRPEDAERHTVYWYVGRCLTSSRWGSRNVLGKPGKVRQISPGH